VNGDGIDVLSALGSIVGQRTGCAGPGSPDTLVGERGDHAMAA
jgi:hypothetical protein